MTHQRDDNEPPPLYAVPDDRPGPDREPPHNHDAEAATLGAALIDTDARNTITALLDPDDFYTPRHELIYDAICTLHAAGAPVDPVTVAQKLIDTGQLHRTGGAPYLHILFTNAPPAPTASYHAQIVADYAARRRIQTAANRIADQAAHATGTPVDDLAADALHQLQKATARATPAKTTSSWAPVNLADVRASDTPRPAATLLANSTGQGLLYPGSVGSVSGEPTSGKSWLACVGVAQEVAAGYPVLYVDFEDRAETLIARLDDLGANPDDVDQLVRYIRPEQALSAAGTSHLEQALTGCRLAIVDGVTEAMTMHGLDLSKNPDVATWLELIPRRLANAGAAVLQIDHVVKDSEARGRYAIGGQHKLAGIVTSYTMTVAKPFAPGKGGHARVVIAKDRHGDVGTLGQTVAELHFTPDPTRSETAVTWSLTPSTWTADDEQKAATGPRYTGYMEKLSRIIEVTPGMNQGDVIRACRGNKDAYKLAALNTLIDEGYLRFEKRGNAKAYYSVAPFREDPE